MLHLIFMDELTENEFSQLESDTRFKFIEDYYFITLLDKESILKDYPDIFEIKDINFIIEAIEYGEYSDLEIDDITIDTDYVFTMVKELYKNETRQIQFYNADDSMQELKNNIDKLVNETMLISINSNIESLIQWNSEKHVIDFMFEKFNKYKNLGYSI